MSVVYPAIAQHLVFPLGDRLNGTRIMKTLDFMKKSQHWSAEELQDFQDKKLRLLIRHAYTNVPYYHDILRKAGLQPDDIRCRADLRKIPILTKDTVRKEFPDRIVDRTASRKKLILSGSSGSTGKPLQFYEDGISDTWSWASKFRAWEWAGYTLGERFATLWGQPLMIEKSHRPFERLKNAARRNLFLPAYDLSPKTLPGFAKKLTAFQPKMVRGYTSSVLSMADYLHENNIVSIQPNAAITTSEKLIPIHRKRIEAGFQCPVFDEYGCIEINSIAHECEAHEGLHLSAENVLIELVDKEGEPVGDGETGEIVLTTLHAYSMPFIRYNVQDRTGMVGERCSCGRVHPLLQPIDGRVQEHLVTPSGKKLIIEYFVVLFETLHQVEQFQIIQHKRDTVEVKLKINDTYDKRVQSYLDKELKKYMGEDIKFYYTFVDDIPLTKGGKRRFVVTLVED